MKYFAVAIFAVVLGALIPAQARAQIFFQGFETDTNGWFGDITRVPSGSPDANYASGINAASGNFFARLQERLAVPTQGWSRFARLTREWSGWFGLATALLTERLKLLTAKQFSKAMVY